MPASVTLMAFAANGKTRMRTYMQKPTANGRYAMKTPSRGEWLRDEKPTR